MPMKWPTLPVIVTKAISFSLFLGTVVSVMCENKIKFLNFTIPNFVFLKILKYWDISKLYGQFGSHCIAGWEITDQVSRHLLLVFMSLIPDMAFVVGIAIAMALKSCNYGTDPGVSRHISKFLPKLYYVPLCMYVFYRQ